MWPNVLGGCVYLLMCVQASVARGACAHGCACSGSPDAKRVDCSNLNLTAVPPDLGPHATILDLSWNFLRELRGDIFSSFFNLHELNMANNLLESLPDRIFVNLSSLRSLFLQNNRLRIVPVDSLRPLINLETLNLAANSIWRITDLSFQSLRNLITLDLQKNEIEFVGQDAFEGLVSLKVLEINGNHLLDLPQALSSLPHLKELTFADNQIRHLHKSSFVFNPLLTSLEMSGNPIETVDESTFSKLPHLKKLTLSEVRQLNEFPDIKGTTSLEHLRIDRARLGAVPPDLCITAPLLRSLNLKSNELVELPRLDGCRELRLLDLSYNAIKSFADGAFLHQSNLIDLFLSHNFINHLSDNTFMGLVNLQVLDLEANKIDDIHSDAFTHFKDLRDLNLGDNKFPKLPTKGLHNLRQLKTFNNRELKEFPPPQMFPRVNTLALSYAYHCCAFMASSRPKGPRSSTSLQETIVWLSKDDVDMANWNANVTDLWPATGNFSSKFEEFANQLWKAFGRDYTIPDNLAQYAEEYFEDYKAAANSEENPLARFSLQCLPEPGPFMPCEDLFGWWSLRCGVWVVFLLALLGNGVVVIVLIIGRSKMDVPRFLVCNLAGADFFMGIYLGMLAVVDASTLGEFKSSAIKWQTSVGCQVAGFLGVLSSELSVFTLSVITLERNYAITHAMHLNKRLSLRHAGYIMFAGWTFASAMAALPLVGISDYKKFAICLPFETEDVWSLSYVVFLILINGVAFLILMGCYLKMYCAIRGSQAWNSNDSRIARRMALLVFTDFICWAPIAFFSLTAVCGLQLISLEEAKVFAIFVLPLNSCANPFLYAIFTKQFKKDCIHICKRIEESRVTRGIGRGRHSSNFSNRHTPVTTNSAAAADPRGNRNASSTVCRCKNPSWKSKQSSYTGWKAWAFKYFLCRGKLTEQNQPDSYTYAIAQIQRNMDKRNKHTTSISSENFSSRSDSWRQGNIPLRLMDSESRRGSWSLQHKTSEDSNMSCSRQDSSTSTFHMSRSSFSSESSSQPRSTRPLLSARESLKIGRDNKPKLCRQSAVIEDKLHSRRETAGAETAVDGLCPVCARRELSQSTFKSKELEEKFACFYNKLVESSYADSSEVFSSKEDHVLLSSNDQPSKDDTEKRHSRPDEKDAPLFASKPHIEVNPMDESKIIEEAFVETKNDNSSSTSEALSNTKEQNERCQSLVNIGKQIVVEKPKKASSDNTLKHSMGNLPLLFRSAPSQETNNDNKSSSQNKQLALQTLRSSKSENIVPECARGKDTVAHIVSSDVVKRMPDSNSERQMLDQQFCSVSKYNENKFFSSSPNITTNKCETSPLIESDQE